MVFGLKVYLLRQNCENHKLKIILADKSAIAAYRLPSMHYVKSLLREASTFLYVLFFE